MNSILKRPPLHFAHANGFPGGSYRVLLDPMRSDWNIHVLDKLGHHPDYPVNHNWKNLVDELLFHLNEAFGDQPVIGVGHSLGSVVTYMAALKAPGRFKRVVLLDPPLMMGWDSLGLKLAKRLGFIDKVTPAGITRGRRSHWPDVASAEAYFGQKRLFKNFHPQALKDYVAFGTEPDPNGGIRLRFEPDVEIEIFRHLADHLSRSHRKIKVPVAIVRGEDSDLMTDARIAKLKKKGFDCYHVPGGHMFPLEHPDVTRHCLTQILHDELKGES